MSPPTSDTGSGSSNTVSAPLFPEISWDDYSELSGAILILFLLAFTTRLLTKAIEPRS